MCRASGSPSPCGSTTTPPTDRRGRAAAGRVSAVAGPGRAAVATVRVARADRAVPARRPVAVARAVTGDKAVAAGRGVRAADPAADLVAAAATAVRAAVVQAEAEAARWPRRCAAPGSTRASTAWAAPAGNNWESPPSPP